MNNLKVSPIFLVTQYYLFKKGYKILSHQGGTRSGKTYNIIWFLIYLALLDKTGLHNLLGNKDRDTLQISIVSRDLPHLKRGALKDFLEIMQKMGVFDKNSWNATDKKYTFKSGSVIEFFSVDDEGKARGSNRDILYVNECNSGIKYDIYVQLNLRTRLKVIIDYNPSHSEHWIYEEILKRDDCKLVISTYRDNYDFLPIEQINEIEKMKIQDPARWRVFGEGQKGMALEGRVFENWKEIEYNRFPRTPRIFGLDFGFVNDPTTLIEGRRKIGSKKLQNGTFEKVNEMYLKEWIYETNLTTPQLIERLKECNIGYNDIIYADGSEPRLIRELQDAGFNVVSAKKGDGSIIDGINYIKTYNVYYEYKSTNLHTEFMFYKWKEDKRNLDNSRKEAKFLNNPIDHANHAMDSIRYLCEEWRGLHSGQSLMNALMD